MTGERNWKPPSGGVGARTVQSRKSYEPGPTSPAVPQPVSRSRRAVRIVTSRWQVQCTPISMPLKARGRRGRPAGINGSTV